MIPVAATVYGVFGAFSLVGGLIGFKKAGSKASLVAGSLSAVALAAASSLVLTGSTTAGLALGGGACLLLAGRFIPAYLKTKKVMPQGLMGGLSVLGILATLLQIYN